MNMFKSTSALESRTVSYMMQLREHILNWCALTQWIA